MVKASLSLWRTGALFLHEGRQSQNSDCRGSPNPDTKHDGILLLRKTPNSITDNLALVLHSVYMEMQLPFL